MGLYRKHRIIASLLFLILGIITNKCFEFPFFLCFFLLVFAVLFIFINKEFVVLIFFPIALLITSNLESRTNYLPEDITSQKLNISGTLHENPEKRQNSWRYIVDVKKVENMPDLKLNGMKIAVYTRTQVNNIYKGTNVKLYNLRLKEIGGFKNPGSFNLKDYFEKRGIYYSSFLKNSLYIQPSTTNSNKKFLSFHISKFRKDYENFVRKKLPAPRDEIVNAVTIGVKGAVPEYIRSNFSKLGISHLLAISGLHIGALALFIYLAIKWILKRSEYIVLKYEVPKIASLITLFPLFIYSAIAGFQAPVLRAFIMIVIYFSAFIFNREEEKLNILAAAAIIILLYSPQSLYELSFQLSFISVLGILIFHRITPFKFSNLLEKLESMIKTTVAASFVTLPIVINNFGYLPVATVPANLFAVPIAGLAVVPTGLLSVVLFPVSKNISSYLLTLDSWIIGILLKITDIILGFKFTSLTVPNISGTGYVLLFSTFFFTVLTRYTKKIVPIAVLSFSLLLLSLVSGSDPTFKGKNMEINFLDTGSKSYNLVSLENGKKLLITGGETFRSKSNFVENAAVIPFLLRKGISRLDYLVLLSTDRSHLNGAIAIMKRIDVENIWTNGSRLKSDFWELIRRKNIKWHNTRYELEPIHSGNSSIEFIKPYVNNHIRSSKSPKSQIIIITSGLHRIILGEGIYKESVQKELLKTYGKRIDADVLFIKEFDKSKINQIKFLKKVSPEFTIVNRLIESDGPKIDNLISTSLNGMVTVYIEGKSLQVTSYN